MGQPSTIPFRKGSSKVSQNGGGGKGNAPLRSHADDADARYAAALKLVHAIDHNLRNGTYHYYDIQGRLLNSLDEVIQAMLTDSLAPCKPAEQPQKAEARQWIPVSELVA